jgi:hypothetical protein
MPEDAVEIGIMLKRNPGVSALWIAKRPGFHAFSDGAGGRLFKLHDPVEVAWWSQARAATRAEIMDSITSGLPFLRAECRDAGDEAELARLTTKAMQYLPRA